MTPTLQPESAKTVTWADETVPGPAGSPIGVRVYRPTQWFRATPVVVHLHSGAFVAGSVDSGRTVSALLAEAGAVVASVDYPLAPQHPFPRALDTAFDVLTHIGRGSAAWAGKKAPLYVAGEEAGGNLAAALALMARDQQTPALSGQILLSPMVDPCLATCSVREAKAGPAGCQWADGWHQYLGSAAKAAHPYASPIGSSRLAGVAPALLVTAEDDLLRDETLNYARRLRESGVAVRQHVLSAPTGWPCALHYGAEQRAPWSDSLRERFAGFFADTLTCPSAESFQHHVQA
jgi:acetyl esterase/lipase